MTRPASRSRVGSRVCSSSAASSRRTTTRWSPTSATRRCRPRRARGGVRDLSRQVIDPERYEPYKTQAAASIVAAGGGYVVRGGDVEVLEGDAPAGRTVVLKFPTMQAAIDWYRSDEYTEIRKIRDGAARARMYVVDGVD